MRRSASEYEQMLENPNIQGVLTAIRYGEGTSDPERGYRTMFGGGTFDDFSRHPDVVISRNGYDSSAAGAYQFLTPTWNEVAGKLGLSDFSPRSQDIAALALIDRRGALDEALAKGFTPEVSHRLAPEWASLPTREGRSYYGQPVKRYDDLVAVSRKPLRPAAAGAAQAGRSAAAPSTGASTSTTASTSSSNPLQAVLSQGQDLMRQLIGQGQQLMSATPSSLLSTVAALEAPAPQALSANGPAQALLAAVAQPAAAPAKPTNPLLQLLEGGRTDAAQAPVQQAQPQQAQAQRQQPPQPRPSLRDGLPTWLRRFAGV